MTQIDVPFLVSGFPHIHLGEDVLAVECHEDFNFLSEEYAELYRRSSATLFQDPVWLHHLYGALAPAKGATPVVISVRSSSGALILVLPLLARRHGLSRWVEFADLGVSDYAAPVADRDAAEVLNNDPSLARKIWAAIGPKDLLRIEKIRSTPLEMASLFGIRDCVRHPYEAHDIPLPSSFEVWRQERDPDFVRQLTTKRKRIGRNKRLIELRPLTDPGEIDQAFDDMRSFRRARFAGRRALDLVQDPTYDEFYRLVARDGGAGRGPGSTAILAINGETVGVTFGLSNSQRDLFVLIGYDYAKWRNYSLGLIMVEELIRNSIHLGRRYHDLTIGHDAYKRDFGTVSTPMFAARRAGTPAGWLVKNALDQNVAARQSAKRMVGAYRRHTGGRGPRELLNAAFAERG